MSDSSAADTSATVQASPAPPEVPPDMQREIRDLLAEIRKQNQLMKRYLFVFGCALAVLLLLQFEVIKNVLNYAMIAAIVLAILLTAPVWSQLIVAVTERIPGFPKWFGNEKSGKTGS